jgi:Skp family chaperone for outer membrane proteins
MFKKFHMRSPAVNKYILTGLALAAGLMVTVETSVKTQAQTPPPPTKIGIVNLQVAMQNTNEGKAAVADLQKRFIDPRTTELTGKQNDIKDMTDRLQRGGNTMSQTAKDELQRQIDAKTKSFQRDVEDYNADRDEEERKILDDLVVKMRTVIEKYALENGFRVILDSSNANNGVLWWANEADVTQQMVEAYDKTQPGPKSTAPVKPAAGAGTGAPKQPTPPPTSPVKPPATPPGPGK